MTDRIKEDIPTTYTERPFNAEDKIVIEKMYKKFIVATIIVFLITLFPFVLMVHFLIMDEIDWFNFSLSLFFFLMFLFFSIFMVVSYKNTKKWLNSKEKKTVKVIKGIVEDFTTRGTYCAPYINVDGFWYSVVGNNNFSPGMYVEITIRRAGPHVSRIDDNYYDVDYILEKRYRKQLAEDQQELEEYKGKLKRARSPEIIEDYANYAEILQEAIDRSEENLYRIEKKNLKKGRTKQ